MNRLLAVSLLAPVVLSACLRMGDGVQVGEQTIGEEIYNVAMPKGGVVNDEAHGKETWLGVTAMSGVDGTPANGVATSHYFEDGTFFVGMQLSIAVPQDGYFYEAWLEGEKPEDWVSLGHLKNPFNDVRHQLQFNAKRDLKDRLEVVVTLEKDDGNPLPGTVAARGELENRTRD